MRPLWPLRGIAFSIHFGFCSHTEFQVHGGALGAKNNTPFCKTSYKPALVGTMTTAQNYLLYKLDLC